VASRGVREVPFGVGKLLFAKGHKDCTRTDKRALRHVLGQWNELGVAVEEGDVTAVDRSVAMLRYDYLGFPLGGMLDGRSSA